MLNIQEIDLIYILTIDQFILWLRVEVVSKFGHHFLVDHQVESILAYFGVGKVFVVNVNVVIIVVVQAHESIVVDQIVNFLVVDVIDGIYNVSFNCLSPVADNFFSQNRAELFNIL